MFICSAIRYANRPNLAAARRFGKRRMQQLRDVLIELGATSDRA
jgi:hypothetical protein